MRYEKEAYDSNGNFSRYIDTWLDDVKIKINMIDIEEDPKINKIIQIEEKVDEDYDKESRAVKVVETLSTTGVITMPCIYISKVKPKKKPVIEDIEKNTTTNNYLDNYNNKEQKITI